MPSGILSVDMTLYVQTATRVLVVKSYWEPASNITTQATLQTLCDTFYQALVPILAPIYSSDVTFPSLKANYYDGSAGEMEAFNQAAVMGGSSSPGSPTFASTMPDTVALLIQRRTGMAGRENRGRIYLAGFDEKFNRDGQWDISVDTGSAAVNIAAFFGSDFTSASPILHARHFSRKSGTLVPITQCRAMEHFGVRRKREIPGVNFPVPAA